MIACKMQDKMLVPARGTLMLPTPTPHPKVDWSSKMFLMIWKCLVASAIVSKRSDIDNDADLFAKFATFTGRTIWEVPGSCCHSCCCDSLGCQRNVRSWDSKIQTGPKRSKGFVWLRGLQYRGILSPPCTQALWDSRKSLARRPKPNVKICQNMSTCLNMFEYVCILLNILNTIDTFEYVFFYIWMFFFIFWQHGKNSHPTLCRFAPRQCPSILSATIRGCRMKWDETGCHVLPLPSLERPQKISKEDRYRQMKIIENYVEIQ